MTLPKNLRRREFNMEDVRRNSAGFPMLYSNDPNHPGLLGEGGFMERNYWPTELGGAANAVDEEVDDKGRSIRKWLPKHTKGEAGPWGNMDTAAYIDSLRPKK